MEFSFYANKLEAEISKGIKFKSSPEAAFNKQTEKKQTIWS